MSAHVTLTLDTAPPASPAILVNNGVDKTGNRLVSVAVTTTSIDAQAVKVWGDVDPTFDVNVQATEGASTFFSYSPTSFFVMLSLGEARKNLFARLRDDVFNVSPAFTDWIDYDLGTPQVDVVVSPSRSKVSKISLAHQSTFGWQSTVVFDRYEVRVVPTAGSQRTAGPQIGTAFGSANVVGTGVFPSSTTVTTTVTGADIEAVSPGDGEKVVKVFVRNLDTQVWSQ